MNRPQFRDTWKSLAPPWMREGNAERYMYVMQLSSDLLQEKADQAVKIRMPGLGDPSQLPYLAHDRALSRGPAEPASNFVARLSAAFDSWGRAGSRVAVLEQLQAYLTGLFPGVPTRLPVAAIVGGSYPSVATWSTIRGSTPNITTDSGEPELFRVEPSNFNWDGNSRPWRAWLILYQALVPTGQSGSAAQTGTAQAGSYVEPGQNVAGVWVPATSGTPVNYPWLTVSGLSGLVSSNVGQWLTLSGSTHPGNVGTFPIVSVVSGTVCVIANPAGVQLDAGPLTWSIGAYPFIGPGMPWGAGLYTGEVFGQGQLTPPPVDLGANIRGTWQPTAQGYESTESWGLSVSADVIRSIRGIVGGPQAGWKSAGTWYVNIIVAFDGGDSTSGNAYSPLSSPGSGNPDGTFGDFGQNVGGVWVPTRQVSSPFDAFCQGTGGWDACSVMNVT